MQYDFSNFKKRIEEINNWLVSEYTTIRTGRATPAILDSVKVDSYGTLVAVNQTAAITVEDSKTLLVSPWDVKTTKSIESAIIKSDLGLSVSVSGDSIRVSFPELTVDRRKDLIKMTKSKLEEAKVSVRKEREKCIADIKKNEPSEDNQKRYKEELENIVKKEIDKLEDVLVNKEKEINI